jgi:hypothetical protein
MATLSALGLIVEDEGSVELDMAHFAALSNKIVNIVGECRFKWQLREEKQRCRTIGGANTRIMTHLVHNNCRTFQRSTGSNPQHQLEISSPRSSVVLVV